MNIVQTHIICFILSLIPSCLWLFFWWSKDNHKEPPKVIIKSIFLGVICAILLFPFRYSFLGIHWGYVIVIAAFIEELLKSIAEIYILEKHSKELDQVIDGIIYGVSIAMGFALIENIIYLIEIMKDEGLSSTFYTTYFIRSVITTFAHSLFTASFGFAYAHAYLYPNKKKGLGVLATIKNIILLKIVFKNISISSKQLIIIGVFTSIYSHLVFNLIVTLKHINISFLLPLSIVITGWYISKKFNASKYKTVITKKVSPLKLLSMI